jgi:hypothetical protein
MSKWADFYKDRMNDKYRRHVARKYGLLIDMVARMGRESEKIAEMGAGPGNISRHLAFALPNTKQILTDRCGHVLELARMNLSGMNAEFHLQDLLSDDYTAVLRGGAPTVIHGHGVLEHFQDEEIRHIVARQSECAKYVLHYVPTNKYKEPSFGDERLMSPADWKRIAKPFYVEEFNDGHDLLLGWRNL